MRNFFFVLVLLVTVAVASFGGDLTGTGQSQADLITYLTNVKTQVNILQSQMLNRCIASASIASNTTTITTAAFSYLVDGVFCATSAGTLTVSAAAQGSSTYQVYLLSINSAGTATCTAGTSSLTQASVVYPSAPSGYTPFGLVSVKALSTGGWTLGTNGFLAGTTFKNISVASAPTIANLSLTGL